jgi:hypothetical protein
VEIMHNNHEQLTDKNLTDRFEGYGSPYEESVDDFNLLREQTVFENTTHASHFPTFRMAYNIVEQIFIREKAMRVIMSVLTLVYLINQENFGTEHSPFVGTLIDSMLPALLVLLVLPTALAISLFYKSCFPIQVLLIFGVIKALLYKQITATLVYIAIFMLLITIFFVKKKIVHKIESSGYTEVIIQKPSD